MQDTMVRPTLRLRSLTKLGESPSEWEGVTEFGDVFPAPFEDGWLRWGYGGTFEEAMAAAEEAPKLRAGGNRAAAMDSKRLRELVGLAVAR